ncbi:unnamed protein product [Sphenostylis stenocarpa]|uniref:Uncharacterized protein n=1 Tax=Sphenostylis stenocarpa TaxID=92480 RepID=A0AA86S0M3_9FABA|nr:unnamed protein product [Sphenostylis stenocarpa]
MLTQMAYSMVESLIEEAPPPHPPVPKCKGKKGIIFKIQRCYSENFKIRARIERIFVECGGDSLVWCVLKICAETRVFCINLKPPIIAESRKTEITRENLVEVERSAD